MPREILAENETREEGITDAVDATVGKELHDPDADEHFTIGEWYDYHVKEISQPFGDGTHYLHLVDFIESPDELRETAMVWLHAELNKRGYFIQYVDFEGEQFAVHNAELLDARREG